MKNLEVETIIAVDLFSKMVERIESRISHKDFKKELKYNVNDINLYLAKDYEQIVSVLQQTVDSFYLNNYEIKGFQNFSLIDFDFCLNHNLGLIKNCKKLIKFIN